MGILTRYAIRRDSKRYVKVLDDLYDGRLYMSKEAMEGTYSVDDNMLLDIYIHSSGLTLTEIEQKNILKFFIIRRKALKSNHNAITYYFEGTDEKVIKYFQKKITPEYDQYPEEERVDMWLQDIWENPERRSVFDYNFKKIVLEFYKREFNYDGEYKVHELKPKPGFMPDMYKIFVCEELRVVHAFHTYELKTQKALYTTLEADYENSPYFDPEMLTDNPKGLENYNKKLKKFAKKVGSEEMDQATLFAFLRKRKNNAWRLQWNFGYDGYKYGKENIWYELEKTTDKEILDILKTYTLRVNPYYYKPFTLGITLDNHDISFSSDFEDKRYIYGCSLKELEQRKQQKSLSEYFGVTADDEWILDTEFMDEYVRKYIKKK